MVKGVSRQVIVVKSPDQELFEQAIFILREDAKDITEDQLLQEARKVTLTNREKLLINGPVWACGGAVCTALVWLLTAVL